MTGFGPGDVRRQARGAWLCEQIVSTGSLVLRKLGVDRPGEVSIQRYLGSPQVRVEAIVAEFAERTGRACAGRRVVAVQDTTEVNFAGRGHGRRGLGAGGDGASPGFFIHPVVAVDAETEAVLGVVGARLWTRSDGPVGPRRTRSMDEKESSRWTEGAETAAARLGEAAQVVVVGDQEADIYSHFARRPAGVELLVRARHDRALSPQGSLGETVRGWAIRTTGEVRVAPKGPGDRGRRARVEIRSGPLRLARPASAERRDPPVLDLGLVEVIEPDPPAGVAPLRWRLLTTLPTDTPEGAAEVVRLYRLRWRIEEVFRALKSDGLKLEDSQVRSPDRLFRLAALALGAAARILQLVDARDGGPRPMADVLDPALEPAVALLVRAREGATPRQKNPHPQGSLAWLAWVVARYGGWNCYGKPPGPKTMASGWQSFAATLAGILIAKPEALP